MEKLSDIWGAKEPEQEPLQMLAKEELSIEAIVDWLHHRLIAINEFSNDEFSANQVNDHLRINRASYAAICNLDSRWFNDSRPMQVLKIRQLYSVLHNMYTYDQVTMIREGKQI